MVNRVRFAEHVEYQSVPPTQAPEPAPHHSVRVVRDVRTGALELDDSEAHRNSYPETDIAWRITASCCIAAFVIVGITYGVIASMSEARNVAETQRKINAFEPLLPATTMPPLSPALAPQLSPGWAGGSVRRLERIPAPPLLAAVKPAAMQPKVASPTPAAIEARAIP